MNLKFNQKNLPNELDRLLLAYFFDRKGKWLDRHMVMKACGFESPISQPVGAYVQFQLSVNRVNAEIDYRGLKIIQDEEAKAMFSLQSIEGYGKCTS